MSRSISLGLLALLVGLLSLTGCNLSTRYPQSLKYPLRQDLLITETIPGNPTTLPSPGQLDSSIRAALEKELAKKNKKDTEAETEEAVKAALRRFDPAALTDAERTELRATLDETFGTPLSPRVLADAASSLNLEKPDVLANGSELYRKHCMHCHGVPGDGRGPTAAWLHPHPRDYRQGQFKFISSDRNLPIRKPRIDDLRRVLHQGLEGTSMPAFGLLPAKEIDALIAYVMHLSIRGETEYQTIRYFLGQGEERETAEGEVKKKVEAEANRLTTAWAKSNATTANTPPKYPDRFDVASKKYEPEKAQARKELHKSIEKGHQLFLKEGICITCHFDYGRQSAYRYDNWGTLVRPRDLTVSRYRGGRRPIDLYWRISGGIGPSGMSPFKHDAAVDPKTKKPYLKEEAYWDLVNFVQALPYPHMLPPEVRKQVYGPAERAFSGKGKSEKTGH